jgi:hypothetical protein
MRDGNDETAKQAMTKGKTMSNETAKAKVTKAKGETMRDENDEAAKVTTPTLVTSAPVPAPKRGDGFADVADGDMNIIRGTMLKFDDVWADGGGNPMAKDRELVVYEVGRMTQKWPPGGVRGRPVSRLLDPGEEWPDVEAMNKATPKAEWRDKHGTLTGPHENGYVAYLIDPKTMQVFTYPTSTTGGGIAIRNLGDDVERARMFLGSNNLYPVVTLTNTLMRTKHRDRQRPAFAIVRFIPIGGEARPLLEEPKPESPFDDEIGF